MDGAPRHNCAVHTGGALALRQAPPSLSGGGSLMEPSGPLTYGELIINADAWEVRLRGDVVELTKTEFEILVALASRPRSVVTEEELTLLV